MSLRDDRKQSAGKMFTVRENINPNESTDAFICAHFYPGHSCDVILDML